MKDKIKDYILKISIFLYLFIIVFSIVNIINIKNSYELESITYESNELGEYKIKINQINNTECKNYINDFINSYENKNYTNIKDMYNSYMNNDNFVSIVSENDNPCYVNKEIIEDNDISTKILSIILTNDSIYDKYISNYELNINDFNNRNIMEPQAINSQLQLINKNELSLIKFLIDNQINYEQMEDINEKEDNILY